MLRFSLVALGCAVTLSLHAQVAGGDPPLEAVVVEIEGVTAGDTPSARLSVRGLESAAEMTVLPVDSGAATAISLKAGRWLVEPIVDGYWSHERLLEVVDGARNAVKFRVWPAARIAGRFSVPRDVEPPESVSLQLSHPGGVLTTVPDDVAVRCSLSNDAEWNCVVPEGVFDVIVRPRGFVPVFRWATTFDGSRPLDLGTLAIKRGSSLSGFVHDPNVERLELRLRPLLLGTAGAATRQKLSKPAAIIRPTPRGFFHFTDISPGFWVIDAWAPGYAVTTNGPFEIHEGAETSLRDRLALLRPGGIAVTVTPPVDPDGNPWRVSLRLMQQDGGGVLEAAVDDTADAAGRLEVEGRQPGRYLISVADSNGNRVGEDVQIVESGRTTFGVVAIDYIRVNGEVTVGDEPLAATLSFGGRFGALTTQMQSDDKGAFGGFLPKAGEWPIMIEAVDGSLSTSVTRNIDAGDDREATVEIALPKTRASGVVVDHAGLPVQGADVMLRTRTEQLTTRSAKDGTFAFRCFPTGRVFLLAEQTRGGVKRSSPPEEFDATEGAEREGIRLTLGLTREVTGRIASAGRPVVGATLLFVLDGGSAVKARSDIDGRYHVEVAEQAIGATVYVSPPGYALAARRVERLGPTFDVEVERFMGELRVAFPEIPPAEARPAFYLRHNGVRVEFAALAEWARGHGADFFKNGLATIPAVEVGTWGACKLAGGVETCDRGSLASGGSTLLQMPALTPD